MKITVGIPAYNEEKNIAKVIARVKKITDSIIVCNDGSSDMTGDIAKEMGIIVVNHEKNRETVLTIQPIEIKNYVKYYFDYPNQLFMSATINEKMFCDTMGFSESDCEFIEIKQSPFLKENRQIKFLNVSSLSGKTVDEIVNVVVDGQTLFKQFNRPGAETEFLRDMDNQPFGGHLVGYDLGVLVFLQKPRQFSQVGLDLGRVGNRVLLPADALFVCKSAQPQK